MENDIIKIRKDYNTANLLCGPALEILKNFPSDSVHCVITSPPYYGLRTYLPEDHPNKQYEIGNETSPEEYIEKLAIIFDEVQRVLHPSGIFWLNIGDCSYNYRPGKGQKLPKQSIAKTNQDLPENCNRRGNKLAGLKEKEIIGIPWALAFKLREHGWYIRQDNIWAKGCSGNYKGGSVVPYSGKDKTTRSHEIVFQLTKSAHYFYDYYGVQEDGVFPEGTKAAKGGKTRLATKGVNSRPNEYAIYTGKRNRRSVWTINTRPSKNTHYATFPPELVEFPLLASTSEYGCCRTCGAPYERQVDDSKPPKTIGWKPTCNCPANSVVVPAIVLDPFCGTSTVGEVALKHKRNYVGIDLDPESIAISQKRLESL